MEKTFCGTTDELNKILYDTFVKQNINSYENFEGVHDLMCSSYTVKSILLKLPSNRAVGRDRIFAHFLCWLKYV